MFDLFECRNRLQSNEPVIEDTAHRKEAAVAILLSQGKRGAECLLMERAWRNGDPWSGQMAFPGGRREEHDVDVLTTAIREVSEEIGVNLSLSNYLARLDDLVAPRQSLAHGLIISSHVFEVPRSIQCYPNDEVHDLVWVPLTDLLQPHHHINDYRPTDYEGEFPGFRWNDEDHRVVWGLTYRLICQFFKTLDMTGF